MSDDIDILTDEEHERKNLKMKKKILKSLNKGMKEKEFEKELKELNFSDGLIIPVYYGIDDEGGVILDIDSMTEEFENKIREVRSILE